MTSGGDLYAFVERYSALGEHRTGTAVDEATRELVAAELERRGATVTRASYEFDRYDATATVTVGDRNVGCVPLFYSGSGSVTTAAPYVAALEMLGGVAALDLAERRADARTAGAEVAVLATGDGEGRLVAENVVPEADAGPLTVLVAGSDCARVAEGPTTVEMVARVVPGHSETVLGWFGADGTPPVVVTTPLSGWFTCAGERATGIAVALETATELAAAGLSVLVVATTGHELGHLGAKAWLRADPVEPRVVLHCGASLAAGVVTNGVCELSEARIAMTNVEPGRLDRLAEILARVRITAIPGPATWGGEGEEWRRFGVPLLSLSGGFEGFHSPDDLPNAVTTPAALACVFETVLAAAHLLVDPTTSVG
ncbi:MAG: M28 family metallopeptidase [Acidimicrobiia bacterium]|nr:M28 family metallopeptidase [Acidimicrobiia bacterium]